MWLSCPRFSFKRRNKMNVRPTMIMPLYSPFWSLLSLKAGSAGVWGTGMPLVLSPVVQFAAWWFVICHYSVMHCCLNPGSPVLEQKISSNHFQSCLQVTVMLVMKVKKAGHPTVACICIQIPRTFKVHFFLQPGPEMDLIGIKCYESTQNIQ